MELKDRIHYEKQWRQIKDMQYPAPHLREQGTWFFDVVPARASKPIVDEDGVHGPSDLFKSAYIIVCKHGIHGRHDFGHVPINEPGFPEKWLSLVGKAKRAVDALNTDPGKNPEELVGPLCANCGDTAKEDDYLCETCRKATI